MECEIFCSNVPTNERMKAGQQRTAHDGRKKSGNGTRSRSCRNIAGWLALLSQIYRMGIGTWVPLRLLKFQAWSTVDGQNPNGSTSQTVGIPLSRSVWQRLPIIIGDYSSILFWRWWFIQPYCLPGEKNIFPLENAKCWVFQKTMNGYQLSEWW